jgi:hypothetical protein
MIFLNKICLLFLFFFFNLWTLQPQFSEKTGKEVSHNGCEDSGFKPFKNPMGNTHF